MFVFIIIKSCILYVSFSLVILDMILFLTHFEESDVKFLPICLTPILNQYELLYFVISIQINITLIRL